MSGRTIIVVAAVIMAVLLCVQGARLASTTLYKPINRVVGESSIIPLNEKSSLSHFAISGDWTGKGSARVFLLDGKKTLLVADTAKLAPNLGSVHLNEVCKETCSLSGVVPKALAVQIIGKGSFVIDGYTFSTDSNVAGLASCPECRKIKAVQTPDHGIFLISVLLLIAIVGSHRFTHHAMNPMKKRAMAGVFITGFLSLTALFVFSLLNPHGTIAIVTRYAASVFAAGGVLTLFVIGGFEIVKEKEEREAETAVWKELEHEEEEWESHL